MTMQDIVERFLKKEEHQPLGPEPSSPPPPPGTQPTLGPEQPEGMGMPPPMAPLNPFSPLRDHVSPLPQQAPMAGPLGPQPFPPQQPLGQGPARPQAPAGDMSDLMGLMQQGAAPASAAAPRPPGDDAVRRLEQRLDLLDRKIDLIDGQLKNIWNLLQTWRRY